MLQEIAVFIVVGAALAWVVVRLLRRFKPGKTSNPCRDCSSDCSLKCPK